MKITAKVSVVMAIIFAAICFGVAANGFTALGDIVDPVQRADASGFASFWAFLGLVGMAIAAVGVWLVRTHKDADG